MWYVEFDSFFVNNVKSKPMKKNLPLHENLGAAFGMFLIFAFIPLFIIACIVKSFFTSKQRP